MNLTVEQLAEADHLATVAHLGLCLSCTGRPERNRHRLRAEHLLRGLEQAFGKRAIELGRLTVTDLSEADHLMDIALWGFCPHENYPNAPTRSGHHRVRAERIIEALSRPAV